MRHRNIGRQLSRNTAHRHAMLRNMAASLLKQDPGKGSIKRKRLTAALDEGYLTQVLHGFTAD